MKNKKGFTLIELIIVIGISSILLTAAYGVFALGLKSHNTVSDEFLKQADIRYSIEIINETLRYSSVGFAITEDDYNPVEVSGDVTGLVKPWSYIGLNEDKTAFMQYKWYDDGSEEGKYKAILLAAAPEGSTYEIVFTKDSSDGDNKMIKYTLKGFNNGNEMFSVETKLEALNALQIINWGDNNKKAIAFSYRTEETPVISEQPVAALAMIIDKSGSMDFDLDGNEIPYGSDKKSRMDYLKETLTDNNDGLFAILGESDSYISLIPFSSTANNPSDFYRAYTDRTDLDDEVESFNPDGATNTGDGMRRAYYKLDAFYNNPPTEISSDQGIKKFVVVLVDGETSAASVEGRFIGRRWWRKISVNRNNPEFYGADGNIDNSTFYFLSDTNSSSSETDEVYTTGAGNQLDTVVGAPYVNFIGNKIQSTLGLEEAFVIGYSNNNDDLNSVADIARALGITVTTQDVNENFANNEFVFIASDQESLKEAFANIGGYINENLWQVSGPKLP